MPAKPSVRMSFKIYVNVEPRYKLKRKELRNFLEKVLTALEIKGKTQVNLSIIGDRKMRLLNRKYRGIDKTTNVLSFSQNENVKTQVKSLKKEIEYLDLGDIVISYPQALAEAVKENVLVEQRVNFLAIHGLLHLLGYDHEKPAETAQMESLENQILASIKF